MRKELLGFKVKLTVLFSFLLSLALIVFASDHMEKGEVLEVFEKFLKGKANKEDLMLIKSLAESIDIKPLPYIRFYAKGLIEEKKGNFKKAIENYLKSIELKSDYNPSYFRFNELIRKVENPYIFREKLTEILKRRFAKAPPVIVENPQNRYVFLVEKMSQYLLIYKGKKLKALYPVTTGKDWEDKEREGDMRTPEGIYYFTEFIPPHRLPKIYGGIAVVLNYPNPVDKLLGKGGSGIWLHGSDKSDRENIPFSTRGCVVADNKSLAAIVPKIKKGNTLIAIYKEIPSTLKTADIKRFLNSWKKSWESKNLESYISHYSEKFQWKRGGLREWKAYKKRVILNKKHINIEIRDLSVVAFRRELSQEAEYYLVEFTQVYTSDIYKDKGVKRLYIIKEGDNLKILAEEFYREVGQ